MFYCALALLNERDLYYRSHRAVHSAFAQTFVRAGDLDPQFHRWLLAAFNTRNRADYQIDAETAEADARLALEQAREFLAAARAYLEQTPA